MAIDLRSGKYPHKACETIIDSINIYEGYFAKFPSNTSSKYRFKVANGWKITHESFSGYGTHDCCQGCAVTRVRVERIEPIVEKDMDNSTILLFGGIALVLYMTLTK